MHRHFLIALLILTSCKEEPKEETDFFWDSFTVTASAYNSTLAQTSGNPQITAFGDTLKPGMRYIAVSRDLLRKGLKYDTPVLIEGFDGYFLVKDKMHRKWKNHIDIYMGVDVDSAKQWGRRKVCIDYRLPEDAYH